MECAKWQSVRDAVQCLHLPVAYVRIAIAREQIFVVEKDALTSLAILHVTAVTWKTTTRK